MSHGVFGGLFSRSSELARPAPINDGSLNASEFAGSAYAEADRNFEFALDALPCSAIAT